MARTKNNSLTYFPLDIAFFNDPRIKRSQVHFGSDGPLLYLQILGRCYGEFGYYLVADDDFIDDMAMELRCDNERIVSMLDYMIEKKLFDSNSFNSGKIITSHGIQSQYQRCKKGSKRDIVVNEKIWILSEEETEGFIKICGDDSKSVEYCDISELYSDISGN